MKKLYWRPQRVSRRALSLIAIVALGGMISVEMFLVEERQSYFKEKMQAARLTQRAFEVVRQERIRRKIDIDIESDISNSGLLGILLSPTTTNPGHLPAKQTSINPNFSAVAVHLLKKAGVQERDFVAVGLSGSFPAINLSVLAALQTLKAQPVVISSVGSSQWGANIPNFLWPKMERIVQQNKIINVGSVALSLGGIDDRALGISKKGRKLLNEEIEKSGLPKLEIQNYIESVDLRMTYYQNAAGENEIKAYINVGGGTTSVGTRVGKKMFKPGLNRNPPAGALAIDSVMSRFAREGVPIIHFSNITTLAERYGFPLQPTKIPRPGEGKIFLNEVYSQWLAIGVLLCIGLLLWLLIRLDWGYRMLLSRKRVDSNSKPEPMV